MKGRTNLHLAAYFVMLAMVVCSFFGCEKFTGEFNTQSDSEHFPYEDTTVVEPDFKFEYSVDNRGNEAYILWKVTENVYNLSDNGVAKVSCSHEHDKYAAAKDVDVNYSQQRTAYSDPKTSTVSSSDIRKVYEDAATATAQIEDGNLAYCYNSDQRVLYTLNGKSYTLPYIKTGKKFLKEINRLPGTTNYRTRAEEFVSDSVCRQFVWVVPCEVVGYDMPSFEVTLRDTIRVYQMDTNDIKDAKLVNENRVVVNETDERCDVEIEWIMKDGSSHRSTESTILKRQWTAKPEYDKVVKNFIYTWRYDNPLKVGAASQVRKDGNFTIQGRTDGFSARLNNEGDLNPVDTDYGFYHERADYSNEFGVKTTFDFVAPNCSERSTLVNAAEERNGYDTRRLNNAIGTTYLGYAQDVAESVFLLVERAHITSEGWDKSNCTETVTDDQVVWNLVYVINWSDGKVERIPFKFSDGRSLTCKTNWNSIEANANHSTSGVNVTVASTENKSAEQDGAVAKWVREYRNLLSTATLAGSTQDNGWTSVEANSCSVTYRDKTFTFETKTLAASNADAVTGGGLVGDYYVYSYSDKLTYNWGGNIKYSEAPGTIKVAKAKDPEPDTFFPPEWGTLFEVFQTVTNNANHNGYAYAWSLHFYNKETGKKGVLPVIIIPGSLIPQWHFEYFEVTDNMEYNSGTWIEADGVWINTIASDQVTQMTWARNGVERANMDYSEAKTLHWDEDRLVARHPSTITSRYLLEVKDGWLTATDTYRGEYMGAWK